MRVVWSRPDESAAVLQEIESKHHLPKASDAKNNKEVMYQLVSQATCVNIFMHGWLFGAIR